MALIVLMVWLCVCVPSPEALAAAPARRLDSLVTATLRADYGGDREGLSRLAAALARIDDRHLAAEYRYWRGFAFWRRAVNGFNETPMPADLREDLDEGLASFRAALAERPGWIEATIGAVGCSANLFWVHRADTAMIRRLQAEHVPAFRDMARRGADNPRALWIVGGAQLGAPPPYGGDAAKAAATMRKGVEAAVREAREGPRAVHVPAWGGPENLMNLAYLHTHSALRNRDLAWAYAQGALVAVPHWHYVRDILLRQIDTLTVMPQAGP